MEYSTSEICDLFADSVDVAEPIFNHYGNQTSFYGPIQVVKCFEDNALVKQVLEQEGEGRVLLIDAGGSMRRAIVTREVADLAVDNGWSGIICYGAVRDVDDLLESDIGILALGSYPVSAESQAIGEIETAVNFAGVTFIPGDYLYADSTGLIISPDPIEFDDQEDDVQ